MTDIVERLLASESDDLIARHLMREAAGLIVRLRDTIAILNADAVMHRGSMAPAAHPDEPVTITDAAPNAPR
jgi:hypothetical protein